MSRGREKYRLQLENRWTDNVDELIAECNLIRDALKKFNLLVIGYDPGVLVCDENDRGSGSTMDIPTWFLKRLMGMDMIEVDHAHMTRESNETVQSGVVVAKGKHSTRKFVG